MATQQLWATWILSLLVIIKVETIVLADVVYLMNHQKHDGTKNIKKSYANERSHSPTPTLSSVCPLYSTKCVKGHLMGCCPFIHGACCADMKHCCPFSSTCVLENKTCLFQQGDSEKKYKLSALLPIEIVLKTERTKELPSKRRTIKPRNKLLQDDLRGNIDPLSSIFCPDERTMCQDDCTCCWMYTRCWGCCPYADAVCCADLKHCCPSGWTCNEGSGYCQNTFDGSVMPASNSKCGVSPVSLQWLKFTPRGRIIKPKL